MARRFVTTLLALLALVSLRAGEPAGARSGAQLLQRWYGSQGRTAVPGVAIPFDIQTRDTATLSIDIYRVELATYLALRDTPTDDFQGTRVRHVIVPVGPDKSRFYYASTHVDVPGLPIGLYGIRVNAANFIETAPLTVSSIGMITAETNHDAIALAVDMTSFHKRPDVTIAGPDPAGIPVDTDGLATLAKPPGDIRYRATAPDGSMSFLDLRGSEDGERVTRYLQTDRPLYRAGDSIDFRILARRGPSGAFTLPSGTADVTVDDPSGKVAFETHPAYDDFGTLHGTFALPSDAQLGRYVIDVDGQYAGSVAVEAYQKPEYLVSVKGPDSGEVIAGENAHFLVHAQYFFGKPAAGMHFHYRAHIRSIWFGWFSPFLRFDFGEGYYRSPSDDLGAVDAQGDATADAGGNAVVSFPTKTLTGDQDLSLSVDVDARDESGKTVTATVAVPLARASLHLGLRFDRGFANKGDDVGLEVTAFGPNGEPRARVPVAIFFKIRDDKNVETDASQTKELDLVSDERGIARGTWHADAAGYIAVVAKASDERKRETTARSYLWIASSSYANPYVFRSTTVAPQEATYAPGNTARFLVASPRADVDALVVEAWGSHERAFVQHLASVAETLDVPIPSDAPNLTIDVAVPTPDGIANGRAAVAVSPTPHRLAVMLRPGKPKYLPGETAHFAIDVRNERGEPVRAQIGIGVADDAVLALAPPDSSDPFQIFYGSPAISRSQNANWSIDQQFFIARVAVRSAATRFQPGPTADVYSISAPAPTPAPPSFRNLRTDFRDTAYWAPSIVTGTNGKGSVTFPWPDNLTSYTMAGLAITPEGAIGSGTGHALVTKDYLVRLATPRFMRSTDSARFVAEANGPKSARRTQLRFSAPALGLADQTVTSPFDRFATAKSDFNVNGSTLGPALLRLAGTSGSYSDGLQKTIPVEAVGVASHERYAGSLPSSDSVALSLPKGADSGTLRIDLSPSIIAELFANVRLLDVYPYYCVEQTMSAALPLIEIERLAKRTGLAHQNDGLDPSVVAAHAIARLEKLQHGDGSWGWWENDPANPYMTAYALYGLTELRKAGYNVPDDVTRRGIESLKVQLTGGADTLGLWGGPQPDSLWNTRAFMYYALADASPPDVDRKQLAEADTHAAKMNPYALSALGLAHLRIGDRDGAVPLFEILKTEAVDDDNFTHWSGGGWHYRWEDDPIETTAYALRFYHAMSPSDPRIARTVAWLRSKSHGSWWYTTKDTAAAIYALVEAIDPDTSEFSPDESIGIFLGSRLVKTVAIHSAVLSGADASIDIPPALVPKSSTLRFVRRGTGSLYWSVDWTRYLPDGPAESSDIGARDALDLGADTSQPFTITRTYRSVTTPPWRIGDQVDVTVKVEAKSDSQFVAIEDPLPAGLEYQPRLHETGDTWSGLQFLDDRVVFFASNLYARYPLYLTYRLRASTVGTFTAPPPEAYAMYGPPTEGVGKARRITILP